MSSAATYVNEILGEVQSSPTANTVLDRLKAISTGLGAVASASAAYRSSASFTPAATSHVAGDVNGGAQEFTSMGGSGRSVLITSATLRIDGGTAEATAWRLHLYGVTPPSATADDAAWDPPSGDRASYLGFIDLGTAADLGSTQWVESHGINKQVKLTGTSLFGYLVNLTTLTPANVARTVSLHTMEL